MFYAMCSALRVGHISRMSDHSVLLFACCRSIPWGMLNLFSVWLNSNAAAATNTCISANYRIDTWDLFVRRGSSNFWWRGWLRAKSETRESGEGLKLFFDPLPGKVLQISIQIFWKKYKNELSVNISTYYIGECFYNKTAPTRKSMGVI